VKSLIKYLYVSLTDIKTVDKVILFCMTSNFQRDASENNNIDIKNPVPNF